ncbi:class-II fumarase/aspartase family protein [Gracilibacillus timonensis]|uniref:class-II fumarase/aspartase family protein n=1 Tax=Gracilibacillus timonensis TaxID=1816696 RepID=UPI000825BD31|nr:adenylosuccinate lyase family protein [Gracilibacillus timonensis]
MDMTELFSLEAKLQRYLEVEAALASTQAELKLIPETAAQKIRQSADVSLLDLEKIKDGQERTSHFMVPVIEEFARVVGDPEGGYVHWGATTQNIEQTGDVLGMKYAVHQLVKQLVAVAGDMAQLADKHADTIMAGRTHQQQAVPITFGFKVATWIDPLLRHMERLEQLQPRLFQSMTGGAVGNFASLGEVGPAVQSGVAEKLGLSPMAVPARNIVDHFTEYVLLLGMVSSTFASIAEEISRLMANEFGEVSESLPAGDVGSSTMPQKRNAKRCMDIVTKAAQVRALVPTSLEAMIQSHEVDGTRSAMLNQAIEQSTILSSEIYQAMHIVLQDLEVYPKRMRTNLDLTKGLINAEAVMMELAETMGRQHAHAIVHDAAHQVAASEGELTFYQVLLANSQIDYYFSKEELKTLLDPATHTGLSTQLAREASKRASSIANNK